ncbi:helix-turn-helix domain-containing protein [Tsukamurella tyrosinosolvens]|uniref:helix-turn-helix domain-containing protein n=1 Tax=Tsukamurella tyrosinosolvens TaxID=57704 RepID=UPI003F49EB7D
MDADTWELEHARRIGEEVKRRRGSEQSAQRLADRVTKLGVKMTRNSITDLENGRRRYVSTAELIALAVALNTSPAALLFSDRLVDGEVEVIPGVRATAIQALRWFCGETPLVLDSDDPEYDATPAVLQHRKDYWPINIARDLDQARSQLKTAKSSPELVPESVADRALETVTKRADEARRIGLIVEGDDG